MNTMKTLTAVALAAAALTATVGPSSALGRIFPGHGPVVTQAFGPHRITCFACNLPRPNRPGPVWGHGWGHGYGYWGHRFWAHPVIYGGAVAPVAVAASAPPPAEPAPQAAAAPCSCLTKQTLPDGSVLFADICTQQSAIAPPQAMGAR